MIDYAKKEFRESWFRDSVLGDISFDNFKRKEENPIYTGNKRDGYFWPVNLFLFKDPKSYFLYLYIGCYGLYTKGYLPVGPCRLMRSKDGGIVSAPNGRVITFVKRSFKDFTLKAKIRSNKNVKIFWNYKGPLGADSLGADASLHSLVLTDFTILELEKNGWKLSQIDKEGKEFLIDKDESFTIQINVSQPIFVNITHKEGGTEIVINKKKIWTGKVPSTDGNIGLLAEKGVVYYIDEFVVFGEGEETTKFLLPGEGIRGAGNIKRVHKWELVKEDDFKFGFGYLNKKKGAMIKWNYLGKGFKLYSPLRPEFGTFDLFLDGKLLRTINLKGKRTRSQKIFESKVPYGYQAVVQINRNGIMPCDTLEYTL